MLYKQVDHHHDELTVKYVVDTMHKNCRAEVQSILGKRLDQGRPEWQHLLPASATTVKSKDTIEHRAGLLRGSLEKRSQAASQANNVYQTLVFVPQDCCT